MKESFKTFFVLNDPFMTFLKRGGAAGMTRAPTPRAGGPVPGPA